MNVTRCKYQMLLSTYTYQYPCFHFFIYLFIPQCSYLLYTKHYVSAEQWKTKHKFWYPEACSSVGEIDAEQIITPICSLLWKKNDMRKRCSALLRIVQDIEGRPLWESDMIAEPRDQTFRCISMLPGNKPRFLSCWRKDFNQQTEFYTAWTAEVY